MAKKKNSSPKVKKKWHEIVRDGLTIDGKPYPKGKKIMLTDQGYQYLKSKKYVI